jgi:hypothetical protein
MIQTAIPSKTTPKKFFTVCIQAPARGINVPADNPTASSGTPIPKAMEKRADPPSRASRDLLIYNSAPASGAATQGPDDQSRQHAHGKYAPEGAPLHPIACIRQFALQGRRKLQLVKAEHR